MNRLIISVFLVVGICLDSFPKMNSIDSYTLEGREIDKITIFYTPFEYKLRRGIRFDEIEERAVYKIEINRPQLVGANKVYLLEEQIQKLKFTCDINPEKVIVRAKICFHVKGADDVIIYFGEAKNVIIGNKSYLQDKFFLSLISIYCNSE